MDIYIHFTYGPALAYYGDGMHLANPMPRCESQKQWDALRSFPKLETIEEEEEDVISEDEDIRQILQKIFGDKPLINYDGKNVRLTNRFFYLETQEKWDENLHRPTLETIQEENEDVLLEGKRTRWDAKFTFGSAYIYKYDVNKVALTHPMPRLDSQTEWENLRYTPLLKTIEEENEEVFSEDEGPQDVILDDENIVSEEVDSSEGKENGQDKKKSKVRRVKSFLKKIFRPLFCCCVGAREEKI